MGSFLSTLTQVKPVALEDRDLAALMAAVGERSALSGGFREGASFVESGPSLPCLILRHATG